MHLACLFACPSVPDGLLSKKPKGAENENGSECSPGQVSSVCQCLVRKVKGQGHRTSNTSGKRRIFHALGYIRMANHAPTDQFRHVKRRGVDPNKKVGGTYINVHAVHKYQTSKAAAMLESNFE